MMKLKELKVYNLSMELGEKIWSDVNTWDYYSKDTIGRQFIKAVDSVAANISEGYGRYHYCENINFCYYSRGSLFEAKTWTEKSFRRGLISEKEHAEIINELVVIAKMLNGYLKSIGKTNNSVSEPVPDYQEINDKNDADIWHNDQFPMINDQ